MQSFGKFKILLKQTLSDFRNREEQKSKIILSEKVCI